MVSLHIDTDIGGDIDDLCALVLALGWQGAELAAVTTVHDLDGTRAALARHALTLAGVGDEVTVARGAGGTLSGDRPVSAVENVERYWGEAMEPLSTPAGDALSLLEKSAIAGTTIVAIGPFTNLALLEIARPGLLASAPLVVMGGYTGLSPAGYPEWGPNMDWNVQSDQAAARLVFARCNPIVVPLSATVQTYLTESDLKRFEGAGPLADLIAKQARAYADEHAHRKLAGENVSLPSGFLNFQHDALAVAVALGWQGASIVDRSMRPELRDGSLLLAPGGQNLRVVTAVDAAGLAGRFVESVMRIT